jgi:hypothetical protein
MPKFCPYCGSPTKENDKFCILCGKPLLTDVPKASKQEAKAAMQADVEEFKDKKKSKKRTKKEEEVDIEEEIEETTAETKKDKKRPKKDTSELKYLPDEVKEQINLYIELTDININKKILSDKLAKILKSTKDPDYEYDLELQDKINLKLEALKTLIADTKKKEDELKAKMDSPFIVQKLNKDVTTKIFQLKNLSREYKLKKMDKSTFANLRDKYKKEKAELEAEREDLKSGMKLWIQELKVEKAELEGNRKLYKGRYSAKEISEEEYKKTDSDFAFKLKKLAGKISTLEKLSK